MEDEWKWSRRPVVATMLQQGKAPKSATCPSLPLSSLQHEDIAASRSVSASAAHYPRCRALRCGDSASSILRHPPPEGCEKPCHAPCGCAPALRPAQLPSPEVPVPAVQGRRICAGSGRGGSLVSPSGRGRPAHANAPRGHLVCPCPSLLRERGGRVALERVGVEAVLVTGRVHALLDGWVLERVRVQRMWVGERVWCHLSALTGEVGL